MRRLALILLLVLGLAPGVWWREALPPPDDPPQRIAIEPLVMAPAVAAAPDPAGRMRLTGLWRLSGRVPGFGSYSALLAHKDGALVAFSDHGRYLRLSLPLPAAGRAQTGAPFRDRGAPKNSQDVEAATSDPASGRIWLGLEGRNAIVRLEADFSAPREVRPMAMQGWSANRGPEAMVRLSNGRFIVLAEAEGRWGPAGGKALLFAGDPVEGAEAIAFRFEPPAGLSPTDMTELPDGRVLILLRGIVLGWPPRFSARLVLADPARIRPGRPWPWQIVARLDPAVPMDNYEGLAVTGGGDGRPLAVWLISDDNNACCLQRTLLARLEWEPPVRAGQAGSGVRRSRRP